MANASHAPLHIAWTAILLSEAIVLIVWKAIPSTIVSAQGHVIAIYAMNVLNPQVFVVSVWLDILLWMVSVNNARPIAYNA